MSEANHGPSLGMSTDTRITGEAAMDACFLVSDANGQHPARVVVTGKLSVTPIDAHTMSFLHAANSNADICCV